MKDRNNQLKNIILVAMICLVCVLIFISSKGSAIKTRGYEKSDITMSQKAFGAWINEKKYLSMDDIKENVAPSTMVVFGSSEFNHLNETMYHPSNVFALTNVNTMLMGTAYNQSLSMATYLGAIQPSLSKKKITLILSAAWFYRKGCTAHDYTKRFSEDAYITFMENDNLTLSEKKYLSKRTKEMLQDQDMLARVMVYDKVLMDKKGTAKEKAYVAKRKAAVKSRVHKNLMDEYYGAGLNMISSDIFSYNPSYMPDWNGLIERAVNYDKTRRNNEYYIDDGRWDVKYQAQMPGLKGSQVRSSFETSPEYDDLRLFLDICKDNDMEVLLVAQPQNGYWYDATGLTGDRRKVFLEKISEVAAEYDATVASYEQFEYEKYFCWDPLHLAGEGWTRVCKDIYEFYNR